MSNLYVQLGRLGDCLTLLPLLHADFKRTGEKSKLMVAREFSSFLDGCSYIDPIVFDGDYRDLERAVLLARSMSDHIVVTSIHGTTDAVSKYAYSQIKQTHATASSFQKEAWKIAGRLSEWDDNLPLVFDRRCSERERNLLQANGFLKKGRKKPVILLALGGVTSPFPYAHLLKEFVTAKFRDTHRVIDLPMVEQPDGRVYDLLAIMEQSALLITTDSMPLHLAWACRELPVFALTNDRDSQGNPSLWHGAPWRPNHLWYCRYHDWPARAVEMCEAIKELDPSGTDDAVSVWLSDHYEPHRTCASVLPICNGMPSREKDGRPFVRDVVRMAMQRAGSDEAIIDLSRRGVSYALEIKRTGASFAYRLHKGQHIPIVDLFSAPKSFWKTILPEIPDLLLDNSDPSWGQALWAIFRKYGAVDASGCCEFVGMEEVK